MKTNWPVKKLGIIAVGFCLVVILFLGFICPGFLPFLDFIILTLTLSTLIWYTYDTHRIANQTLENALRPVILRSGYIDNWESIKFEYDKDGKIIKGTLIQFSILKNIAKNISGFIIVNGYKYTLLFGNDISKKEDGVRLSDKWGWMKPESSLYAGFNDKDRQKIKKKNQIYIEYKDMESNQYYTLEDENFSQKSFKK